LQVRDSFACRENGNGVSFWGVADRGGVRRQ